MSSIPPIGQSSTPSPGSQGFPPPSSVAPSITALQTNLASLSKDIGTLQQLIAEHAPEAQIEQAVANIKQDSSAINTAATTLSETRGLTPQLQQKITSLLQQSEFITTLSNHPTLQDCTVCNNLVAQMDKETQFLSGNNWPQ